MLAVVGLLARGPAAGADDASGPPPWRRDVAALVFVDRNGGGGPFDGLGLGSFTSPTFGDLDADGDLDALSGELGGHVLFLENVGTPSAPVYIERTGADNPLDFADSGNFSSPELVDIDDDGDLDVFAGSNNNTIRFYRNVGTPAAPAFVEVGGADNPLGTLSSESFAFADLDADDDQDLASGTFFGEFRYFENVGSAARASFVERTGSDNPFQGFDIGITAAPAFADIDDDGDQDLLPGNSDGHIRWFENVGTPAGASFEERTGPDNPLAFVDVRDSEPAFADIDGDGDLDAFSGEVVGRIRFWPNVGAPTAPGFVSVNPNPLGEIDTTSPTLGDPAPAFVDLDADGDFDAFVGGNQNVVLFLRNDGDAATPAFVDDAPNPLAGFPLNGYNATPGVADVDADGDYDVFLGESYYGRIKYFENVGSRREPRYERRFGPDNPFDSVNIDFTSKPTFADVDADGDVDAFIGTLLEIRHWENVGTPSAPSFLERVGGDNPLDAAPGGGPTLADLDEDCDRDAVIGRSDGTFSVWENVGTGRDPIFLERVGEDDPLSAFDVGASALPALADIDDDGDQDLFSGEQVGEVRYFANETGAIAMTVVRQGPPIEVPAGGGEVRYLVRVANNTGEVQSLQLWRTVVRPDGSETAPGGPVALELDPGERTTRGLVQQVPAGAAPGAYLLQAHIGLFPGLADATDCFVFRKQ